MTRRSYLSVILLCALLSPTALLAQRHPKSREGLPTRNTLDAGNGLPDGGHLAALSLEDQEVIDNLELLEHMEESEQLDLLLELSRDN